jgi:hypothetical protein
LPLLLAVEDAVWHQKPCWLVGGRPTPEKYQSQLGWLFPTQPAWELKGDPKGGFRFVMVVPLAIIQRKWMTIFGTESYGIVDPP